MTFFLVRSLLSNVDILHPLFLARDSVADTSIEQLHVCTEIELLQYTGAALFLLANALTDNGFSAGFMDTKQKQIIGEYWEEKLGPTLYLDANHWSRDEVGGRACQVHQERQRRLRE